MKKIIVLISSPLAILSCGEPKGTDNKENLKTLDSLKRETTTVDKTNTVGPKDTFSYDRMPVKDSVQE
jgi:hypothetical protein